MSLTGAAMGCGAVVVLQELNMTARVCDHVGALKAGRLVTQSSTADLMRPGVLAKICGCPCTCCGAMTAGRLPFRPDARNAAAARSEPTVPPPKSGDRGRDRTEPEYKLRYMQDMEGRFSGRSRHG